jgi:hypothetical protein
VSSLAVLIGAELNAEIEHASPYGKEPGEKEIGDLPAIVAAAPRPPRPSDWILGSLFLGEAAILTYARLRSRVKRLNQSPDA